MEKSCDRAFLENTSHLRKGMNSEQVINGYSSISLAYVGDAVFDLYIRSNLAMMGLKVNMLHKTAIKYVNAKSQSLIVSSILEDLTDEEEGVYKRGRNSTSSRSPKNTDINDYRRATGFEALIGYLYIKGDAERLLHFLKRAKEIVEEQKLSK